MLNGAEIRLWLWSFVASASATAIVLAGSVEPGHAQQDFFDRETISVTKQPSFVLLSGDASLAFPLVFPLDANAPILESLWLDPSPIGAIGSPSATFIRSDEPSTTGTPVAARPESCPEPLPPTPGPKAREPEAEVSRPEKLIGRGSAVWYELPGNTASGESYDPEGFTAGHRTLPFGARVRVVNEQNGRSVVVRINDRGPVQKKFVIDLSRGAAKFLGITGKSSVSLYEIDQPPDPRQAVLEESR
jgi:rare lipoprotein A